MVKKEKGVRKNILCHMRLLSERETPLALALHEKIAQEIGDENIFCAVHTIEESIRGEGFVIGIFSGNRLVAMRAVSYEGKYMEEALADLRLPLAEKEHAAVMDFCITEKTFAATIFSILLFLRQKGSSIPNAITSIALFLLLTFSALGMFFGPASTLWISKKSMEDIYASSFTKTSKTLPASIPTTTLRFL